MHKLIFCLLLAIAPVAFSQESSTVQPSSPPATSSTSSPPSPAPLSKKDLMARDKIFFVTSDTFYVKKEELEKGLLNREEFEKWGLLVTHNQRDADAILYVRRAAFQNNFPYTVTDRQTGIVIMGGEVNSLFGTVPGKIAGDIVNKLRPIYEPKPNTAKPSTP
ncbi:MAG TPA: hypothetical protein VK738_01040 [Terriglobales bacterium]|jgi:hypothetical protein|nr:hypothetical protein [Terriglobales bacterium]